MTDLEGVWFCAVTATRLVDGNNLQVCKWAFGVQAATYAEAVGKANIAKDRLATLEAAGGWGNWDALVNSSGIGGLVTDPTSFGYTDNPYRPRSKS